MVFQKFSSSCARISTDRVAPAALLGALVLACSGTDVGYPRVSAISACATGGVSSEGGGSGNVPSQGAGGVGSGGSASAGRGGSTSMPGAGSGGSNSGGVVGQGGVFGTGGSGPSGGQTGGGASGSAAGGSSATGGSASAGAPGGSSATGGSTGTGFQWPTAYDAAAVPMPAEGHHNPGSGCMISVCHGTKVPFVFGGTVYKADGVTGAPNVQVGIFDGALTLVTYTAANGNIWLPSSAGAVTWANAVIAIRNKNGEHVKAATAPREASCNVTGCHNSANRLIEP